MTTQRDGHTILACQVCMAAVCKLYRSESGTHNTPTPPDAPSLTQHITDLVLGDPGVQRYCHTSALKRANLQEWELQQHEDSVHNGTEPGPYTLYWEAYSSIVAKLLAQVIVDLTAPIDKEVV